MRLSGKDLLFCRINIILFFLCMGQIMISASCFLEVLVLLFFIDLSIHEKRLPCVPQLSKMSNSIQSYQNNKSEVKIQN